MMWVVLDALFCVCVCVRELRKRLQNETTLFSLPSLEYCCLISWQFPVFLKSGIFRAQQFAHRLCSGSRRNAFFAFFTFCKRKRLLIEITKMTPSNIEFTPLLRPHSLNANLLSNEEPKQMEE